MSKYTDIIFTFKNGKIIITRDDGSSLKCSDFSDEEWKKLLVTIANTPVNGFRDGLMSDEEDEGHTNGYWEEQNQKEYKVNEKQQSENSTEIQHKQRRMLKN